MAVTYVFGIWKLARGMARPRCERLDIHLSGLPIASLGT